MRVKRLFGNTTATWVIISIIVVGIIGINLSIALGTVNQLSSVQTSLDKTSNIIMRLESLHLSVVVAESGQRGYLLTEYEEYLNPYHTELQSLDAKIKQVREIKSDIGSQKELIDELLILVDAKIHELTSTVDLALREREKSALRQVMTNRGRDLYREIRKNIKLLVDKEYAHRRTLYSELETIQRDAKVNFGVSAITSGLLVIGMFLMARINLRISTRYQEGLEEQNEQLLDKVAQRTQELTIYSEELSRSNRELEDFAFVASHDLQEPLRKIQAFSDRLTTIYKDKLDERGVDYIKRMTTAAFRMSTLINDLLEFSRITTRGKDFVEVELDEVFEEVLGDLEIAIKESDAQINVAPLPRVCADPSQIYQLFLNVLSNGLKFRNVDQAPLIDVSVEQKDIYDELQHIDVPSCIITIKDNGIGFEQTYADKIFSPFQRLHGRTAYKGTGIGLAVCRRIVERHGGTITAHSVPNEGATFIVTLPIEAVVNKYMGE
ncbi:sensor histidine kinase [Paraglaciecola sp. 20A4]|uniref:sensor histidine kinase n=1 Tax=Paraglaciecola sp. 20A4 TaxID=2687288 RepID=UPI00140B4F18|nr:sensor histidine kinase [Paraglaciecola sp. 20A4]